MTDRQKQSPYAGRPRSAFWKASVGGKTPATLRDLYKKKYVISPEDNIATAGSCFAQHIARNMKALGYNVMDVEPAPDGVSDSVAVAYGYGVYSARYGNIYYARQLLQLAQEALGQRQPADFVWERDGRYFDALRPSVEPNGLETPAAVVRHRERHLQAVKSLLEDCDVFIFTFGLTEAWEHIASGTVYPTAPGTIAGSYDPTTCRFVNFGFNEVYGDFVAFKELVESINPSVRFLVTVSPVPLAATASDTHVLPATIYSKSVLRAVTGQLANTFENVDYFPSYEIITNVLAGQSFFDEPSGLRNVTPEGVKTAMTYFFAEHKPASAPADAKLLGEDDVICEEVMLEAFGS
ncbi:hypothetical protein LMG26690_01336 [Achromobacter animicus]|uniref:GSCFA domain-containing protein n=1 Tax=Achromobacter animicus TaxID=1389935 RepID=A0A6S7AM60_9BURK|nr:GSCFA domain-containing protein [Achromobacter animicus]CAB3676116.1 hypothetical protein LMG26690_01336 [Achromobacter animicus]